MKLSIFPVCYSFHRAYTKISTIFGSAHNFLHKIKHKAFLNPKEKGETTLLLRSACLSSAQAGPLALGPRAVRTLLSLRVADGRAPSVSSLFYASGGSAASPAAASGVSAYARAQQFHLSPATLFPSPKHALLASL